MARPGGARSPSARVGRKPRQRKEYHAREGNGRTRAPRQARRQGGLDAGRRVRPRRDSSRARRQARRTLNQTGHRHRAVESTSRGREARTTGSAREGDDETKRGGRKPGRTSACTPVAATGTGDQARIETRGPHRRVRSVALASGNDGRTKTVSSEPTRRRTTRRANEGPASPPRRRAKGGKDASTSGTGVTLTRRRSSAARDASRVASAPHARDRRLAQAVESDPSARAMGPAWVLASAAPVSVQVVATVRAWKIPPYAGCGASLRCRIHTSNPMGC